MIFSPSDEMSPAVMRRGHFTAKTLRGKKLSAFIGSVPTRFNWATVVFLFEFIGNLN